MSALSISNLKKIVEIHDKLNTEAKSQSQGKIKSLKSNIITEKTCPENKILNQKTNRCNKLCPVGKTKNNKNRCVNDKNYSKTKKMK